MKQTLATIYLVHHTHTDIGFTHEQPVVMDLHAQFIDQAIESCERTADYPVGSKLKWTCETVGPLLHWLKRRPDRQIQRFVDLEKRGLIEVTGMFAVMSQCSSHESIYRQFYPVDRLRKDYGLSISSAMQCDINGHSWGMVEALLDCGFDGFSMAINETFGRAAFQRQRPNGLYWEGASGQKILTWNGLHYDSNNYFGFPGDRERIARGLPPDFELAVRKVPNLLSWLQKRSYPYPFVLLQPTFTNCTDNGPVDPQLAEFVRWWNEAGHTPRMEIVTPREFFKVLRAQPKNLLPTHRGEWTDYWNFGATSTAYETALNRRTYHRLYESEFASLLAPPGPDRALERQEAWENAWWFDEHTWGANTGVIHPFRQPARSQSNQKLNFAYRARSFTQLTRLETLDRLARSVRGEENGCHVLVVNALPWEREERLQFPASWLDTNAATTMSHVQGLDRLETSEQQGMGDYALAVTAPVKVPAMGYRLFHVKELRSETLSGGSSKRVKAGTYENSFFRISLDSKRGGIASLFDKIRRREWVDSRSEYPLGGYVHEQCRATQEKMDEYGGRMQINGGADWSKFNGYRGWNPDWPSARCGATKVVAQTTTVLPGEVKFHQKCIAPGTRSVEYDITLAEDKPYVDLRVTIDKLWDTAPEACYVAFPFSLPKARPRYQTAGGAVRPHEDQLPGCNQDFHTAQQWVDFSNDTCGVTVTTADAPIVMFGGFNIGKVFDAPHRNIRPLFLSMAMCNYWHTNYAGGQLGEVTFHYRIYPHDSFDVTESNRVGQEACYPLLSHPIMNPSGGNPSQASLVEIEDPRLVLLAVKASEDGKDIVLRLFNSTESAIKSKVIFPCGQVIEAWECDHLENPRKKLKTTRKGFAARWAPGKTLAYRVNVNLLFTNSATSLFEDGGRADK